MLFPILAEQVGLAVTKEACTQGLHAPKENARVYVCDERERASWKMQESAKQKLSWINFGSQS
eukprot:365219-Chlamydomonas_euryale.AAC.34